MYQPQPPSSSSSPPPPPQRPTATGGLTRYVSAPGAFLSRAVDSVIGGSNEEFSYQHHQYFSGDSSSVTTDSTCKVNSSNEQDLRISGNDQRRRSSFGLNEIAHEAGSLVRQKSSPAGFFSHLLHDNGGFSITRESGGYNSHNGHAQSRLKSQLSFTTGESSLSRISEGSGDGVDGMTSDNNGHQSSSHSYPTVSYGMESWENSIMFSEPPNKKTKGVDGDIYTYNVLETQFSLPQTAFEISTAEKLMNIPEDSVPCKVRAKRGCATHPRSIAERERRIRISGRLKKLQELVPNMDKQTSYADMLDLAVQHIKGLQNEVQKIRKEMEGCTCGCKPNI